MQLAAKCGTNSKDMATKPVNKKAKQPTIIRIVNILIGRTSRREVLTFLLFVLLSFVFWIIQTSREESIAEYYVEFVIEDQPQDMVFTTHVPNQLKVAVEDNNINLLNYAYDDRLKALVVDFERYADATGNFRISAAELQSLIRMELNGSTKITSISPSLIDARFAQTEGRKFPIYIHGQFLPADNYRIRPAKVKPDSVIINAPTAVLDTMKQVYTILTKHAELRDTLREVLSLDLPLGVKATPAEVTVTVPVAQYVERVFDNVHIRALHVPNGRQLTIFPLAARISCLVDFNSFNQISASDFEVTVDYDSITSNGQDRLPIAVRFLGPEEQVVSNVNISPRQVEFIIER